MKNFILGFLAGMVTLTAYGLFEIKSNQLILTGVPVQLADDSPNTTNGGYSQADRDSFTALLDGHK